MLHPRFCCHLKRIMTIGNDNSLKSNKQINLLIKLNIPILQNGFFVQKYFCGSRDFKIKFLFWKFAQVAARYFCRGPQLLRWFLQCSFYSVLLVMK